MDVPMLAIVLFHLYITGQMGNGMYQQQNIYNISAVWIDHNWWVGQGGLLGNIDVVVIVSDLKKPFK